MIQITEISQIPQEGVCVLRYTAGWCSPCTKLSPILDKVSEKFSPSVNFRVIDIDQAIELAKKFKIRSVPTVLFLNNGVEVDRSVGLVSFESLENKLQNILKV